MSSRRDFNFGTKAEGAARAGQSTFWIELGQPAPRTAQGGAPLLTRECTSLAELEAEVKRLKAELDQALSEARATLRRLAWSR